MAPIPTLALVEQEIRRRNDTDRAMSYGTYWLWTILLGIFTLGFGSAIYGLVINFQMLNRRNDHFARQQRMFGQVASGIREQHPHNADVANRLLAIETTLDEMRRQEGQRNPWLWMLLLPIVTLGLASFWTYYWLTVDWRRHSIRQQRVTDELSAIFRNLGYTAANLIDEGATPDRNYCMHLVLTIVTFGAWYIYWFYLMFKDGNNHMAGDHFLEDQLVNTLRVSGAGTAAP